MEVKEFVSKAIEVPYVCEGRDFSGWDCWGIVKCFYELCLSKNIADISVSSFAEQEILVKSILREASNWREIKLNELRVGDLLVFRPLHVGIYIGRENMLHADEGINTCIERYTGIAWAKRLIGTWRCLI